MNSSPSLSFDNTENAFISKTDRELRQADFLFSAMNHRWLIQPAKYLTPWMIRNHLPVRELIRRTIYRQFCGGESLQETGRTAAKLQESGLGVILDYGVESRQGEEAFDATRDELIRLIRFASGQPNISYMAIKITGFARFSLLEKLKQGHALEPRELQEYEWVIKRVQSICQAGADGQVGIMVDAEQSWIQDPVDRLCMDMMRQFNRGKVRVFHTFQLYRLDRLEYLQECCRLAASGGFLLGAKLVRGAYMEKERKRAAHFGYRSPILADREATDLQFNNALEFCLGQRNLISLVVASHNEYSNILTTALMARMQIPRNDPHVLFSQLFGMSDHISFNLAKMGYRTVKYLPYGPVEEVIPYLMRRAQENSSVSGQTSRELNLIRQERKRRARA